MDISVYLLDEAFLAVLTSEVLDREMEPHVILHVAALVLLSVANFTDENLSQAASTYFNDIGPLVQGVYVYFTFLL